jgi:IS1 family transposase
MNQLNTERRAQVVRCLVEGNSIRSTVRMTGAAKNTIVKLLAELGNACLAYQDKNLKNLPCERVQVDEIWSFCYSKQKNVPAAHKGELGYGDLWTWTALDADSKLIVSFMVGRRNEQAGLEFIEDLEGRLANRIQLSSDGLKLYVSAVQQAFRGEVDYAIIHKVYNDTTVAPGRYSPAKCCGIEKKDIMGNPDGSHVSTSYVERQNLTMRMSMRRFTRLTNAFSKKAENHLYAVALHFMYYNFCRAHQTLTKAAKGYPTTPAMASGLTDRVWTVEDIIALLDEKNSSISS